MTSPAGSRSRWSSGNVRVMVWVVELAGKVTSVGISGGRVPVVAPEPVVGVVHLDVHGQGLGRVSLRSG